ncbi:predicted protein [Chaetomium globosum CBS 148.51]|uniref:Uncharacterized protein n=1 Tax=Chaetomium globosum (strain ATCC 6205 / CBS 148.51 / DSM 1962 / NBRC 6347 / NRRL 1970) TaxID=306901 RepID=Q2GMS6_CHAGB|nr:uncharacterized protein CHGG_10728 [Chaetomium globosum CBS 148.51]EAQ82910.1 predicted protein [Chaetomium globosum CBS 148.51]
MFFLSQQYSQDLPNRKALQHKHSTGECKMPGSGGNQTAGVPPIADDPEVLPVNVPATTEENDSASAAVGTAENRTGTPVFTSSIPATSINATNNRLASIMQLFTSQNDDFERFAQIPQYGEKRKRSWKSSRDTGVKCQRVWSRAQPSGATVHSGGSCRHTQEQMAELFRTLANIAASTAVPGGSLLSTIPAGSRTGSVPPYTPAKSNSGQPIARTQQNNNLDESNNAPTRRSLQNADANSDPDEFEDPIAPVGYSSRQLAGTIMPKNEYAWVLGGQILPVAAVIESAPPSHDPLMYTAYIMNNLARSGPDESMLWSILRSDGGIKYLARLLEVKERPQGPNNSSYAVLKLGLHANNRELQEAHVILYISSSVLANVEDRRDCNREPW